MHLLCSDRQIPITSVFPIPYYACFNTPRQLCPRIPNPKQKETLTPSLPHKHVQNLNSITPHHPSPSLSPPTPPPPRRRPIRPHPRSRQTLPAVHPLQRRRRAPAVPPRPVVVVVMAVLALLAHRRQPVQTPVVRPAVAVDIAEIDAGLDDGGGGVGARAGLGGWGRWRVGLGEGLLLD